MSSSTIDPLDRLYREAKRNEEYQVRCYRALTDEIKARKLNPRRFREYDWRNLVVYYYAEIINFPEESENIYTMLIYMTASASMLNVRTVMSVLKAVDQELDLTETDFHIESRSIERLDDNTTLVKVEDLEFKIPQLVAKKLLTVNSDINEMVKLLLRYQIMGRESGFFWSIDTDLYSRFPSLDKVTQPLFTLECFASPLNHYLEHYCSAFEADREAYASEGNFFDRVKELKEPVRFIYNPPYTGRIINESAKLVIQHMDNYPGSEFIAMLPDWADSLGSRLLSAYPNSSTVILQAKDFTVFDYSINKSILGLKPFILIVNIGGDKSLSNKYCVAAKKRLQINARALQK